MQQEAQRPEVLEGQQITLGSAMKRFSQTIPALVTQVRSEPGPCGGDIDVIYEDCDGEAIVTEAKWTGDHWERCGYGGYAKRRPGMQGYIAKLKRGR